MFDTHRIHSKNVFIISNNAYLGEVLKMKIALFTVSFNRPDLMQQLLDGLKENIEDLSEN